MCVGLAVTGFESATGTVDAANVFLALEAGFVGQSAGVEHAPVASARRDAVLEYPGGAGWLRSATSRIGRGCAAA